MSPSYPLKNTRTAVIANELAWHEQEAHRRMPLDTFLYAPPAFDQIVQSSFEFLDLSPGEFVLDMGCGEGKETLQLARRGLLVVSTDLSHVQLCRARHLVQEFAPGTNVYFVQANAEELPFATDSFRIIHGKAIIHHLDIHLAALEIKRLLKQNGRATFAEPMAHHPIFWLGRQLTPRYRTKDEHPLTYRELQSFSAHFSQAEIEEFFFLTPLSYFFRILPGGEALFRRVYPTLHRIDQWLFTLSALLRRMSWYSMVKVCHIGHENVLTTG
jgi:SAM-dependent methyltransferase